MLEALWIDSVKFITGDVKNDQNYHERLYWKNGTFSSPEEMQIEADVVIDFSNPTALPSLLRYAEKSGMPMVLCTTGYSELQVAEIKEMSQKVPIFYSGNMSLGINLLIELSKKAAQVFGNAFDVEIVEKHHNQKSMLPAVLL